MEGRIRGCLSSPHFSILLNGTPKDLLLASRGLRQGDPTFTFLFTMLEDPFSQFQNRRKKV